MLQTLKKKKIHLSVFNFKDTDHLFLLSWQGFLLRGFTKQFVGTLQGHLGPGAPLSSQNFLSSPPVQAAPLKQLRFSGLLAPSQLLSIPLTKALTFQNINKPVCRATDSLEETDTRASLWTNTKGIGRWLQFGGVDNAWRYCLGESGAQRGQPTKQSHCQWRRRRDPLQCLPWLLKTFCSNAFMSEKSDHSKYSTEQARSLLIPFFKHLSPAEREKSLVIADHKKLFYSN